jgi:hypothetical protein
VRRLNASIEGNLRTKKTLDAMMVGHNALVWIGGTVLMPTCIGSYVARQIALPIGKSFSVFADTMHTDEMTSG